MPSRFRNWFALRPPLLKERNSQLYDQWARERESWPNHASSSFVEADGIYWHVQQMGSGPELLLVHGTGASTHSWRDVMPLLARNYRVTAMDLPGHAFTDSSDAGRSSINGMSRSLAGLLAVLQVQPRYCVGHSAGAVIVCRMVLAGHLGPRAIVSVNGAFMPLRGATSHLLSPVARLMASNLLVARLIALRAKNTRATVERLIASTGSSLDEQGVELYARLIRKPRHVAGALRMMGNWNLQDFKRELPRLAVPLTLIVGDNDLMVPPAQAQWVRACVGDAAVRHMKGLGHLAHEEDPVQFAQQVAEICRG